MATPAEDEVKRLEAELELKKAEVEFSKNKKPSGKGHSFKSDAEYGRKKLELREKRFKYRTLREKLNPPVREGDAVARPATVQASAKAQGSGGAQSL